jgi:hypothetical protein
MCMGCMTNADFVVTSGILGAASMRVGARRFLPRAPRWARKVSDAEAAAFVASLDPATPAVRPPARHADVVGSVEPVEPVDEVEAVACATHADAKVLADR